MNRRLMKLNTGKTMMLTQKCKLIQVIIIEIHCNTQHSSNCATGVL